MPKPKTLRSNEVPECTGVRRRTAGKNMREIPHDRIEPRASTFRRQMISRNPAPNLLAALRETYPVFAFHLRYPSMFYPGEYQEVTQIRHNIDELNALFRGNH